MANAIQGLLDTFKNVGGAAKSATEIQKQVDTAQKDLSKNLEEAKTGIEVYAGTTLVLQAASTFAVCIIAYYASKSYNRRGR